MDRVEVRNGRSVKGDRPFPVSGGRGKAGLCDALVRIAFHLFHVLAFDANEAGRAVAPRRMQIPFVIEIGLARGQLVFPDRPRLPWLSLAWPGDREVIGHDRLAARLAV